VKFIVIMPGMGQFRFCLLAAMMLCAGALLRPDASAAADILTLDEAISRALRVAPALETASAQSDLSGARVNEARAPLYPSVAAGAEYIQAPGYDKIITNRGQTSAQLLLDYIAYDGGRRDFQVRAARYAAEAAALGVNAARAQIVFDTTVAYFDLMRTRAAEKELGTSLQRLSRYVAIIEALERSGRAITNDVLKLRTARDAAELALATAHQASVHASILLGSILGDFGRDDLQIAEVSGLPSPPTGDLTQSPAYKAALRQVEAARLGVNAAEAEHSPTLKIVLTAGWEGIDPPKTFGHHLGASYDGAVSMPLFQGGLVRSHIDEAKAVERTARAQQRQVELVLKRDLADAGSRYQGARRQLDLIGQSQTTANDAFALLWTRFLGGGKTTLLEVIDAYQQAENLRMARFDQEFGARQASAQAQLILGLAQ
jgi:outer membrane protein TolC